MNQGFTLLRIVLGRTHFIMHRLDLSSLFHEKIHIPSPRYFITADQYSTNPRISM